MEKIDFFFVLEEFQEAINLGLICMLLCVEISQVSQLVTSCYNDANLSLNVTTVEYYK